MPIVSILAAPDGALQIDTGIGQMRTVFLRRTGKVYQNNVVNMPGVASRVPEILVIDARSLEETSQAIQALWEWKIVILKLTGLQPNQAQRAADFVTGGTYAIDGHIEWIGEQTLLFTPRSVQISIQG